MFDLVSLMKTAGYTGLFGIIFAESGLLFGFFLPGDSLLFTAGFLSSQGYLDIRALMVIAAVAAITGDSVGYALGYKIGPKLFTKEDSLFFKKTYVYKARKFFEKHGAKTIVLARFVPAVRTFAPVVAGIGNMRYRTFIIYNIVGGLLWTLGLGLLGFFLGNVIPNVDHYILPMVALIILLSILPGVIHVLRDPDFRRYLKSFFRKS